MGHGRGDSIGKGRKFTGVSVDCVEKLNFAGNMYASTNAWIGHKIIIKDICLTYTHAQPPTHSSWRKFLPMFKFPQMFTRSMEIIVKGYVCNFRPQIAALSFVSCMLGVVLQPQVVKLHLNFTCTVAQSDTRVTQFYDLKGYACAKYNCF